MTNSAPKIAVLTDQEVARIRALEAELGEDVVIIAYDKPLEPARLSPDQVDKLMDLERELSRAYLVAYRKPKG